MVWGPLSCNWTTFASNVISVDPGGISMSLWWLERVNLDFPRSLAWQGFFISKETGNSWISRVKFRVSLSKEVRKMLIWTFSALSCWEKVTLPRRPPESMGAYSWNEVLQPEMKCSSMDWYPSKQPAYLQVEHREPNGARADGTWSSRRVGAKSKTEAYIDKNINRKACPAETTFGRPALLHTNNHKADGGRWGGEVTGWISAKIGEGKLQMWTL